MTQVWLVLAAACLWSGSKDVFENSSEYSAIPVAVAYIMLCLSVVVFLLSFILFFYNGGTTG